jgi:hypothetical protein
MLHYYDNKPTVDELLAKPNGFLHLLDKASKTNQDSDFILGECMEESNRHVFWFSTDPHMPDSSMIPGTWMVYDLNLSLIVKPSKFHMLQI